MTKQIIILIVAGAVIFFSLGLIYANYYAFQAGWSAAKQRLEDSGLMPAADNLEIKTVSGEVAQIKDNQIEIKIQPIEPLADPALDTRIVQIQDDTKVYQIEQKSQADYQKEIEEFNKKLKEQAAQPVAGSLTSPEPFIRKQASLSDIKVGQRIYVLATDNIRTAKEFKAVEISIGP